MWMLAVQPLLGATQNLLDYLGTGVTCCGCWRPVGDGSCAKVCKTQDPLCTAVLKQLIGWLLCWKGVRLLTSVVPPWFDVCKCWMNVFGFCVFLICPGSRLQTVSEQRINKLLALYSLVCGFFFSCICFHQCTATWIVKWVLILEFSPHLWQSSATSRGIGKWYI